MELNPWEQTYNWWPVEWTEHSTSPTFFWSEHQTLWFFLLISVKLKSNILTHAKKLFSPESAPHHFCLCAAIGCYWVQVQPRRNVLALWLVVRLPKYKKNLNLETPPYTRKIIVIGLGRFLPCKPHEQKPPSYLQLLGSREPKQTHVSHWEQPSLCSLLFLLRAAAPSIFHKTAASSGFWC